MSATVNYKSWPDVAASLDIPNNTFEKWIKYGYVNVIRDSEGALVVTNEEQERLKHVLRIARIANIDQKKVFEWIEEGSITALEIGGQWIELSKSQVDNPPDIVFNPTQPIEITVKILSASPPISAKLAANMFDLSLIYLQRWINYKYIAAFRNEDGVLMIPEFEIRRNKNLGELAEYCNVGRVRIHGWIVEGTVTGLRVGDVEMKVSRIRVDSPNHLGLKPIKRYPKP